MRFFICFIICFLFSSCSNSSDVTYPYNSSSSGAIAVIGSSAISGEPFSVFSEAIKKAGFKETAILVGPKSSREINLMLTTDFLITRKYDNVIISMGFFELLKKMDDKNRILYYKEVLMKLKKTGAKILVVTEPVYSPADNQYSENVNLLEVSKELGLPVYEGLFSIFNESENRKSLINLNSKGSAAASDDAYDIIDSTFN